MGRHVLLGTRKVSIEKSCVKGSGMNVLLDDLDSTGETGALGRRGAGVHGALEGTCG